MPIRREDSEPAADSLWYKDAIIYQLHVKAFSDSNRDGIGDFRGLTDHLDYLQDLGITAIWLLPFCPSPLRDDGYDIADYKGIHASYGTIGDFKRFLKNAHQRGIRVITELVVNHTSDQHPWFQRSRRARPGSRWRNFYVWSDTAERYADARVIFQDFENSNWSWDSLARAYYWHRFYSHQPDLNFDNPEVQRAILRALDFWLDMGVDGLRLDAVPYLFEREGTNCENLPETHDFLKKLRARVDARFRNKMLLAEANQWPEDAVAYFGRGDECHMAYHFPVMPRLFMALHMEDYFPIMDIMEQTPDIPEICQWAVFLRNHDELTLEMVTDEERDYMYRVYAQNPQMRINLGIRRRLAPLLGNHRKKIELLNAVLFSMPGTPIVYYGDEIGMGDNIYLGDRNGVRTPMQWSSGQNAGFSAANPQQLYLPIIIDPEYHYEVVNVETHQGNPFSLLWWMKRLIALRKAHQAFGRGTLEFLHPENRSILAYLRRLGEEKILVVVNLSRFSQCAELDLSSFEGMRPVEMFGRTEFFPIRSGPYPLTLGPYSFYWFKLEPVQAEEKIPATLKDIEGMFDLGSFSRFEELFQGKARGRLERSLAGYLAKRRWFAKKAFRIKTVRVLDAFPLPSSASALLLTEVDYYESDPETYALALAFRSDEERDVPLQDPLARLEIGGADGFLVDAAADVRFGKSLVNLIARRRRLRGAKGELAAAQTSVFRGLSRDGELPAPVLLKGEQSNTSIAFGDRFLLKLFRRIDEGTNPDLEIGLFLTRRGFPYTPHVAGSLDYRRKGGKPSTLAVMHNFISNQGNGWDYTLGILGRTLEHLLAGQAVGEAPALPRRSMIELAAEEPSSAELAWIDTYIETARIIGVRTAEMHLALASDRQDAAFRPEPFTRLYQRSVYQSMQSQSRRVFQLLRRRLRTVPEPDQPLAERVLELEKPLLGRLGALVRDRIKAQRIRCHGDYHLGQLLFTGKDFVIIDYEGEPSRPISERRIKGSPLKDVAGMLRSFHYAAHAALIHLESIGIVSAESKEYLVPWSSLWYRWTGAVFLRSYTQRTTEEGAPPAEEEESMAVLLDAYLLEKAIYELAYELNNRPGWVKIPLLGLLDLLES